MNDQECANCATYGWKQVEDTTKLQKCSNCKLIAYCGKECQTEHWKKLHKSHCKYFKDPSLAQPFYHRVENCALCLLEHQLKQSNNPNYKCTMDVFMKDDSLKKHYHPHPFPSAGAPGDTVEKAIIFLEHLVCKKIMIQPGNYDAALIAAHGNLLLKRCIIWGNRKMFPQAKAQTTRNLRVDNLRYKLTKPDSFQLRKSIRVVKMIFVNSISIRDLKAIKDPLDSLHAKFHSIVAQALDNSTKYLSVADEVLQALASQVVPYEEVLKIICGGSLKQRCSFCSEQVIISAMFDNINDHRFPNVFFDPLIVRIYGCGRKDCHDKMKSMDGDSLSLAMAITTTRKESEGNQCDFCFQLPPTKDMHRCGRCRTKMYCSVSCKNKDWDIHKLACKKEDVEERKVKAGSSDRREVAAESKKEVIDKLEKDSDICEVYKVYKNDICEVFDNLKLKQGKKKAKK